MFSAFIPILGSVVEGFLDISKSKAEAKKAKITARADVIRAEGQAALKHSESVDAWEAYQAQASVSSWKDEAWTIFFIGMLLANFVPGAAFQAAMTAGFERLAIMPMWMQAAIGASIAASFGVRTVAQVRAMKGRKQ